MPNNSDNPVHTKKNPPSPAISANQLMDDNSPNIASDPLSAEELMASAHLATPVMAQWFSLKSQEQDALLFFRMGDFYELFFNDAHAAATALDIALTSRGTHNNAPIAMCGVPVGSAQTYLSRLIRRGFRVAIAEQTETPKKGQKGPLKRDIVRVVTPGTLTEDELLEAGRANILLALAEPAIQSKNSAATKNGYSKTGFWGAAWIDISTGHTETISLPGKEIAELLSRLDPSEILANPSAFEASGSYPDYQNRLTPAQNKPALAEAEKMLCEVYKIAQTESLGDFSAGQLISCAMLLRYVRRSQAGRLPHLTRPAVQGLENIMGIDPATRHSLDILQSRDGSNQHTLFASVDLTRTSAGMRLLAQWLSTPSTKRQLILSRQDGWAWMLQQTEFTQKLRHILGRTPDSARALGRISSGRALPRDLAAIRDTLQNVEQITALLQPLRNDSMPDMICQIGASLYGRADTLMERLISALAPDLPARLEDGGVIATGYDDELDRLRELRDGNKRVIAQLQARLSEKYNISTLRIRHHNQLGYVIEVPTTASARLRQHSELHLRQGTASLARFSTDELAELDRNIIEASEKASQLERHFFFDLCKHILDTPALDEIAIALAQCDVLASCTELAASGIWCRPTITEGRDFMLKACRHPVVEAALAQNTSRSGNSFVPNTFIPNDCALPPEKHVMLLTGPNMAGKSTFLRQNALAVILAQAGLPLPAQEACIGIVDRLFSRVGAADDLARGRSTFMVEMTETAAILNQAGPRSLVVVDEIGRGTSTLDGLSIAWATLEALHSHLGARTIFATHFHELNALLPRLPQLAACTMAVKEWEGNVIFQHEVKPGHAGKSWGLHVAKIAGLPRQVLERARQILDSLEIEQGHLLSAISKVQKPEKYKTTPDITMPLFGQTDMPVRPAAPPLPRAGDNIENQNSAKLQKLCGILDEIDPNSLSPREAHSLLYRLKDSYNSVVKGFI